MAQVSIAGKTYVISNYYGEVAESSKDRETKVHSTGGGDTIRDGRVRAKATKIHSNTTVHDSFYLINEVNDSERVVNLQNWDVSIRNGHNVKVVWVNPPKSNKDIYVAIYNKQLDKTTKSNQAINQIAGAHYRGLFFGGILLAIVLGIVFKSIWIFLILLIATLSFYFIKTKEVSKDLENFINEELVKLD